MKNLKVWIGVCVVCSLSLGARATMLQDGVPVGDELPVGKVQEQFPTDNILAPNIQPSVDLLHPSANIENGDSPLDLDDAAREQRFAPSSRRFGEGPPRRDSSEEQGNMRRYPGGEGMGMGMGPAKGDMRPGMGGMMGMGGMGVSPIRMEMQKLDRATQSLRNAKDEPSRKAAIAEIRDQLNAQFDRDLKRRADELTAIEERLKALQAQVQKRKDAREQIIDLRLNTMINEADGLGFPDERRGGFPGELDGAAMEMESMGMRFDP